MKPSAILSGEHRVIEQVLDCLEKMAECVEAGSPLDTAAASKALDFFRNFADRCHHGKEESHFFPAMEQKGFVRDGGPTGVMLYEHELGRQRVAAMAQALASLKGGTAHAANGFAAAARAFISLLRNHIEKEDHCLFPMADQAFNDHDQAVLLEAFQRVETEHMGVGVHEGYIRMADELAEHFGVPKRSAAAAHRCCGH